MNFIDAKPTQRADYDSRRGRVDQEYPSGANSGDEDTGDGRTDDPRGVERRGISRHRRS
jgi:hypothetical protein